MSGEHAFGHHVTMRLVTSQVIAPTVSSRRRAARVLHEEGARRGLLAFRFADSHVHALLFATREQAGRFARYAEQRLRWHLGLAAPFERARFEAVQSQRHLERAFLYILRQEERHDIRLDPRHEASSAPDILGMRVIAPYLVSRVFDALPRLRHEELVPLLHLERTEPDFGRLADAAAAALALPHLQGRSGLAAAGRAAAVQAAPELATMQLAKQLGVTRRCIERLRHLSVPAAFVEAVRRQLTLRSTRERMRCDQHLEDWANLPHPGRSAGLQPRTPTRGATKIRRPTDLSSRRGAADNAGVRPG